MYITLKCLLFQMKRAFFISKPGERKRRKEKEKTVHGHIEKFVFVNLVDLGICINYFISCFALFYSGILGKILFIHFACLITIIIITLADVEVHWTML